MKIDIFNAEEKYDILYTDPPWQQGRGGKKAARPNSTGTTVPYETMDVPGIMELHRYVTNELMNEKHNVFMWTIDKYLPQTEEIMSLLGYKLHARLIWDKGNGPPRQGQAWSILHGTQRKQQTASQPEAGMCLSDVRNIFPTSKETGTLRKGGA